MLSFYRTKTTDEHIFEKGNLFSENSQHFLNQDDTEENEINTEFFIILFIFSVILVQKTNEQIVFTGYFAYTQIIYYN